MGIEEKMFDAMMDMPFEYLEDFSISDAADVCAKRAAKKYF